MRVNMTLFLDIPAAKEQVRKADCALYAITFAYHAGTANNIVHLHVYCYNTSSTLYIVIPVEMVVNQL